MRNNLLLMFCLVMGMLETNPLWARNATDDKGLLKGKVLDASTGTPIADVTVYCTDLKSGTKTNADGYFELKNIPDGKHLVEISHIGYASISEYVEVAGITERNFTLMVSAVENSAVIVTGVGAATQSRKAPFQVLLLRADELRQSSATNIIDALTRKPGISSLSTGPAISKPVIRGLGYNRVLTINDGVRQEGQQWGDEHGIEIDEASVSKIEIVKGPASLVYGSDALAGVINIITNVPVEQNTIRANVQSSYQTNNQQRSLNGNIAGNIRGWNWNLYGSGVAAADYSNAYDGKVFNSKFHETNWGGYLGYNGSWGFSHLIFSKFDLNTGLVEGERNNLGQFIKPIAGGGIAVPSDADFNSTDPQIPYQHIRHFKVASDSRFSIGQKKLSINLGWQQNQREEFGNPDDLSERALYFDLHTFTYTAQLQFPEKRGWKTTVGLGGMQQTNQNKGVEQLIPDYRLFDLGGFVYSQKTWKSVTFSGGLRLDGRWLDADPLLEGNSPKGAAFNQNFSNVSGSIGAAWQVSPRVNLKLNVARGFRAPSIPELGSNGAHEGTIRYEYGNINLKSETSIQLDAGIDVQTEHVSLSASVYYNAFDNYIFYRKLSAAAGGDSLVDVDGEALQAFTFDQTKATLKGIETSIDFHPHPLDWLHIQNSFSYVSGTFNQPISGSSSIPFIPAARWLTEIRTDIKKLGKHLQHGYIKFEIDHTFNQGEVFTAFNTETETPGYTLLNAGLGASFTNRKGQSFCSINIIATNLADVAYQNHLSRLKYAATNPVTGRNGVFNMGRNVTFRLLVPLTFSVPAGKKKSV